MCRFEADIALLKMWILIADIRWVGDNGVEGLSGQRLAPVSVYETQVIDTQAAPVAALSLIIAASVNSLVKGGLATVVGGRVLGLRVGVTMLLVVSSGLAVLWLA